MDIKYINLLLNKCLNFDKSKILFINYDKVNRDFVEKVMIEAKKLGVEEIYLDEDDIKVYKNKLETMTIEELKKDAYFDKSIWNTYALKHASFLILDTEFPGYLEGLDEKIGIVSNVIRNSRKIFREMESKNEVPWVIAALPNKIWGTSLYGEDGYVKLKNAIYKMCMIDTPDPIKAWEDYLKHLKDKTDYLNSLEIEKLHYTNSLGTDLYLTMPKNNIWTSIADDLKDNMLVNMPSYEVFTSPDYRYTKGIVYSSKPLIYGGGVVDEFYFKFNNGKVVNYGASKGKDILKSIIESDSNSCYLGECAIVDYNSPISNTGMVFKTTLIDENASCHLALGDGFNMTIPSGINMNRKELLENGINSSLTHVDFMIGTPDMKIEAITKNGVVTIFENGNFIKS